jgi:thiol-disulfide isomerase/thioredoxin
MFFRHFGFAASLAIVLIIPGCSEPDESTDTTAAETQGGDAADVATASDEETGAGVEVAILDEAVRGRLLTGMTGFAGLPDQLKSVAESYAASPKDPEAVMQYIGLVEQIGMMQAQQDNRDIAHEAFRIGAGALNQAAADGVELESSPLQGYVHYNMACVLAVEGKTDDAVESLNAAFSNGFADLATLESDEDMAAIRELSDFDAKKESWQALMLAQMKQHAREELENGESFPFDFQLASVIDGAPVNLADHVGKVCIVDIWGTWCPPCRAEIPSFIKLQEKFGSDGFQMLGLNQEHGSSDEENAKKVSDYISENGINYPCALISDDVLASVPNFEGFPTTLFIDRTGKVRMKAVGLHEYEFLEAVVEALLAEASPSDSTGD